ncbi:hypothetical protein WN51_00117 [Melipona quadrifasciata]|uniref:Uncharacterized protein n=1 Tax=Melipona quadrifasciata TaxID=166423 RepID=A0A0M9AE02_9HYME|nr:hypothetical protein WN51_00117 [Melipona quadrifasciata]
MTTTTLSQRHKLRDTRTQRHTHVPTRTRMSFTYTPMNRDRESAEIEQSVSVVARKRNAYSCWKKSSEKLPEGCCL